MVSVSVKLVKHSVRTIVSISMLTHFMLNILSKTFFKLAYRVNSVLTKNDYIECTIPMLEKSF